VEAETTQQLPYSLDGIELRRIGGRKSRAKTGADCSRHPRCRHDDSAVVNSADLFKVLEEAPEGHTVEVSRFPSSDQATVPERTAPKYPTLLRVGWCRTTWSLSSGAIVLLEMHLVERPQVNGGIRRQQVEFFLCALWRCGSDFVTSGRGVR